MNNTLQSILDKVKSEGNFKVFFYKDYKCMIRRIEDMGHLCGYVAIPKGHILYKKSYTEIEEEYDLIVHGGLTFSDFFGKPEIDPNAYDNRWYIGFDCAHAGDLTPNMYVKFPQIYHECDLIHREGIYKDMEYVTEECKSLVDQILEKCEK